MYNQLKSFLNKHDIFYQKQYGFRDQRSTEHAILDTVNRIQGNMNKGMLSCGVFIDLQKAFDTVDHHILLQKLNHYGIRGIINDWFCSYLVGRIQSTQIGSRFSKKEKTLSSVPQGSVLGPLLFLIYINDIHNASDKLEFYLFADDTNWLYTDKNLRSLETTMNLELSRVCEWLTANKLSLNIKKTNFVIFHPYQKRLNYEVTLKIYNNHTHTELAQERKDYIKYLGVLIDSHLTWKYHISHVGSKISRNIGIIARLRHFTPFSTLQHVYRSPAYIPLSVVWSCRLGSSCSISFRYKDLNASKKSGSFNELCSTPNKCYSLLRFLQYNANIYAVLQTLFHTNAWCLKQFCTA